MKKLLMISILASFALACANGSEPVKPTNTTNNAVVVNKAVAGAPQNAEHKTDEETPSAIKSAFNENVTFTKQHKDISGEQAAAIEKGAGAKPNDTDFHSYLASTTENGTRKQVGVATMTEADGKEIVIVYDNKEGQPIIKEVRADGVAKDFLAQFAGKGHDSKLKLGEDVKPNGVDEKTAKAMADAVRVDVWTIQTLYGSSHSH